MRTLNETKLDQLLIDNTESLINELNNENLKKGKTKRKKEKRNCKPGRALVVE